MRVPVWLTLGVAVLVCVFGAYRIRLAFRSDDEDERARSRKGLYAMARRTHLLVGIIYLLLGGALIATTYGWSPLGNLFSRPADPPPTNLVPIKDTAPTERAADKATPSTEGAPAREAAPAEQAPEPPSTGSAGQPPK